jgi:hypothetical protein
MLAAQCRLRKITKRERKTVHFWGSLAPVDETRAFHSLRGFGAARRRYAEFLQRVKGCAKHTLKSISGDGIVVINPVDGDVGLIAPPTGNRSLLTIDRRIQGL